MYVCERSCRTCFLVWPRRLQHSARTTSTIIHYFGLFLLYCTIQLTARTRAHTRKPGHAHIPIFEMTININTNYPKQVPKYACLIAEDQCNTTDRCKEPRSALSLNSRRSLSAPVSKDRAVILNYVHCRPFTSWFSATRLYEQIRVMSFDLLGLI